MTGSERGGIENGGESADATAVLHRVSAGHPEAREELFALLYDQLRRIAGNYLRGNQPNQTLQATALVHEAYLKLIRQSDVHWRDRAHFFGVAASAMRQILVDHVRTKGARKRGGKWQRSSEDGLAAPGSIDASEVLALDEALTKLASISPEQARIVELRFYVGLTIDEIAEVTGVSARMIEKYWRRSRAWSSATLGRSAV